MTGIAIATSARGIRSGASGVLTRFLPAKGTTARTVRPVFTAESATRTARIGSFVMNGWENAALLAVPAKSAKQSDKMLLKANARGAVADR